MFARPVQFLDPLSSAIVSTDGPSPEGPARRIRSTAAELAEVAAPRRPVFQNRMLKVTKNVRPQPAARGPSVREGFAVFSESFASVTL